MWKGPLCCKTWVCCGFRTSADQPRGERRAERLGADLQGGSTLQDVSVSVDPTQDIDTQVQPSPPLGLLVGAGCRVGDVVATGAPRIEVQDGASMGGFDGLAWAEFFSAAPPTFDAAPLLRMFGRAEGDHDWVVPAESAGLQHTEVSYRGADYTGDMAGSKPAGVSRVFCDLLNGAFWGNWTSRAS